MSTLAQIVMGLCLYAGVSFVNASTETAPTANVSDKVVIGSKNFGESYLLSEIAAQVLERQGFAVERRFGLGGTLICFEALRNGEIDFYMEYTGTLSQAVLKVPGRPTRDEINTLLASMDLHMLDEIGFNNTYAIAVRESPAQDLGLVTIADLA